MDVADGPSPSFEKHVCISDHRAIVRERVGDMIFEYPGGSFFQNNNSVLVPLTDYVREAIFLSTLTSTSERPTHLVDAYCGAGLFAITYKLEGPFDDLKSDINMMSALTPGALRELFMAGPPDGQPSGSAEQRAP